MPLLNPPRLPRPKKRCAAQSAASSYFAARPCDFRRGLRVVGEAGKFLTLCGLHEKFLQDHGFVRLDEYTKWRAEA